MVVITGWTVYVLRAFLVCDRFIKPKWLKVAEAGLVAAITGLSSFIMITSLNSCTDTTPADGEEAIVAKVRIFVFV